MLREDLLRYIKNQTFFFDTSNVSDIFTAKNIAEKFNVKRNTVSHHLNQLVEEGVLVKVNTRPVYFFSKSIFENQNYPLEKSIYQNLNEIAEEKPFFDKKKDFFSSVIGSHGSLSYTIEQLKMAALYPNGGLPVFLSGASGTGKSFLITLFHQYCIANDVLEAEAPLVTVNCAQYADNPELLTSSLFGHVKGAFTGATEDQKGAFEAADGGLLFLDEVHRLSAEGQEKLFTYLDNGVIHRVGDSTQSIKIHCRLAFATTEDSTSTFLTTFLRRIPVQIPIPALNERTQSERKQLILQSFYQEQKIIGKKMSISPKVINILMNRKYKGNVGELKNLIKIIVAKSFANSQSKKEIAITIHMIPTYLLSSTKEIYESGMLAPIIIDGSKEFETLLEENEPELKWIVQIYEKILLEYVKNDRRLELSAPKLSKEIERLFDHLLFDVQKDGQHNMMLFITQHVRQMLETIENSFQISFNGSIVYAISHYLFQRRDVDWVPEEQEKILLIEQLLADIRHRFPNSYQYAEQILVLVKNTLDIELSSMDRIILSIYINNSGYSKENAHPKAIIVAHGYATASSIANVANRLLNELIFQSFDMPLDVTPKKIAENITHYIEKNDISNGLMILFDMGSLKEIYQYFPKDIKAPIAIMNNVTTGLAIAVGEVIQKRNNITEIPTLVEKVHKNRWEIILPELDKEKVLITTCSTGIGTAVQISNLLEKSMPSNLEIKIIPCEYKQLTNPTEFEKMFEPYDIIGIIGTDNPRHKGVPFISLERLISGKGTEILLTWVKNDLNKEDSTYFNNQMIRNFSLDQVIQSVTILDTEKVIAQIELFMKRLEELWNIQIRNDRKLALYVHVSCMIERLIRNVPIDSYTGRDTRHKCHEKELSEIKDAFSVVEKVYSVRLPDYELFYIYDVLFGKTELTEVNSEF
ncbi:sigma 54-interacting transcriptional regulator [Enterococcus massiliensis]|uniref:sigma 54-interacting transcriptional regulator n=1 Tax=Enterococcus massiliensis TaxID=1640685 RepID=UPI00065E5332|nr:sigma 54-interacting transcriptional regulator [Enterococcus massiliensis]